MAAGEVPFTRAQLEQQGWRVIIATEFADRLREAGFPPSAH